MVSKEHAVRHHPTYPAASGGDRFPTNDAIAYLCPGYLVEARVGIAVIHIQPSLTEFYCAVLAALLLSALGWATRRIVASRNKELRRYTLLGSVDAQGNPLLHDTTRGTGTVITRDIDGQRRQFELTDALLRDGTYAAEPLERYL
ncbi:hypothetical protein OG689_44165 [Kitasatospora sp. NBC_00240]|uniref:hypothetical protein n=1 Tax=Kitasatospora sp. NBC_00240 TaxID=2903567 RepID=UPI002251F6BA|nr:hypothetical protein [Kitasatospora sp. NBC_00240]MCX5216133.1 hypothetical protein [Kitasatospora sp. NBC_00240]